MSTVRSRWLGRLKTREGLLARAQKAYAASKTKAAGALVRTRRAQVTAAKGVLSRHPARSRRNDTMLEAAKWIGRVESPYGSNRAPWGLTAWQSALGSWLVGQAWCGVFVYHCLTVGGKVKGLTYRCASVLAIEADAAAGKNGWKKIVPVSEAMHGDAVTLFGGEHVELVLQNHHEDGYLITIGGNTSSGDAGSQSNGGGVFKRTRPISAVHKACRPKYS